MAIPVTPEPKVNRTVYENFKGVDFSKDESQVDKNHSPYCVNMISDKGGQPEKRVGWRVLGMMEKPVNAMQNGEINGIQVIIIHSGTKLYKWEPYVQSGVVITKIYDNVNNAKSSIFFAMHENRTKCFILTGTQYLVYDGTSVQDVSTIATIPLFMIAKNPDGGGTQLNPLNLLQPGFTESFKGKADVKIYQMSFGSLDPTTVTAQVRDSSGAWIDKSEGTDFSVNRITGTITFTTAPGVPPITGEDNVKITAYRTVDGYADRIKRCRSHSFYGIGGNNRVFVTRHVGYKANDWWSELNNATYFPDINYAVIGNENTAVMGYAKLGENQIIIKEDNQQDTTVFSRSGQLSGDSVSFPVKLGITGVGAISPYSFAQLIDEPLFLARNGVYAITSNAITQERSLANRSYYVDPKLTKENGIENATAVQWDNYYLIAINGNIYLLDSRQRSGSRENPTSFVYECFYWENVPARCFMVYNGDLYFGTELGQLCRFNTDIQKMYKYNDNGDAITAVWTTNMDDDNLPEMTKTMMKKGCVITTKPFTRSSVDIGIKTNSMSNAITVKKQGLGILDFNDIDFGAENFTFISNANARKAVLKKKIKKYEALQFVIKNDKINEGLGIFNITKSYTVTNYIKG